MRQVFISYSHDSAEHRGQVADFVRRLRADRVNVTVDADQYPGGPDDGWPAWSEKQVEQADLVLVVSTPAYCARYEATDYPGDGRGAACEAQAIRQLLYEAKGVNPKFRVVLFQPAPDHHIPLQLRKYHRFRADQEKDYRELLAWIRGPAAPPSAEDEPPAVAWADGLLPELWNQRTADRRPELEALEEMATGRSATRILLLEGNSNTGKSHVLAEMANQFRSKSLPVSLVDFKGCPSLEDVLETIVVDIPVSVLPQTHAAGGASRKGALIQDLRSLTKPLLLVFDVYEKAPEEARNWLEGWFLGRLHGAPGALVVIGGQEVPEPGAWQSLALRRELEPIPDADDWLPFAQQYGNGAVTRQHIEAFAHAVGGVAGPLSALLKSFRAGMARA